MTTIELKMDFTTRVLLKNKERIALKKGITIDELNYITFRRGIYYMGDMTFDELFPESDLDEL